MSQSTDAIIAFGFDLGDMTLEEILKEDPDGEDFEDWLATQAGVVYPAGHAGIESAEYEAYKAARDAAIAACPVELVRHCSDEYTMYFLALRRSVTRASRGYPEPISLTEPTAAQREAMAMFCAGLGIDWQEPAWHIFSMWG